MFPEFFANLIIEENEELCYTENKFIGETT